MATKKKPRTTVKKRTMAKRKPSTKKKTVKTAKVRKRVQEKKRTQKKTAKEKTKKVARPAKKPVQKKVKERRPKASAKQVSGKVKKPAVKVGTVSRRTPPKSSSKTAPSLSPRKELLRKHLIDKREEIVKEAKNEIAKYIQGETNQLVETALDDGDWSVIDLSADINLRRLETHRERLLRIDEALIKLREGTYGVCEECGGEITPERLKVMPFAIYCRDCQEKKEQIEKIQREEIIT